MRRIFVFGILVCAVVATTGHSACAPAPGGLLLWIDGVQGESTNQTCRDYIELASARISAQQSVGTGGNVTITKAFDKASGALLQRFFNGRHIPSARLYAVIQGAVVEYEFTDLLVSSLRHSANPATETMTLDFAKFKTKAPASKTQTRSTSDRQAPAVSTSAPLTRSGVVLNGSVSPKSFPVSMKLDDQPASVTGITFTARKKSNGRPDLQMLANSTAYSQFATRPVTKAVITLSKPDGSPYASYTLQQVRVSQRGGQTLLGFETIEWKLITPGSVPTTYSVGSSTPS